MEEDPRANDQNEWRQIVLYQHRMRTQLSNERKYVGWLSVSFAIITLGFLAERIDLFLARMEGVSPFEALPYARWAPVVVLGMGAVLIATATWEYFADRRRIATETKRWTPPLTVLVAMMIASLLVVAALFYAPSALNELPRPRASTHRGP